VVLAFVIIGGIKRIAHVAETVVPTMALIYVIGALAVIFANLGNIGPSFISIFQDAFSGSAAIGGFMGASFAYAMDRGINRGLFSNEAGQGSAPIAHASAKGNEPASEGMVSLLEPFIDTIIICTLTGLVILSSGVWNQKHQNEFARADMVYVDGQYSDKEAADVTRLFTFLDAKSDEDGGVNTFSGEIQINNGIASHGDYTLLNARSVAEDVIYNKEGQNFTGSLIVKEGVIEDTDIAVSGKSLVHSVQLTTVAFKQGLFGDWGQYIVTIGLLLFAFTTTIAWSYYGDRAITYLLGPSAVLPYRIVYVAAFFIASFTDATVIWNLAYVTVALMTIPNLIGILILHKDMKQTVADYWKHFKKDHAD